jgi:signal transduction histidine kinase
MATDSSCLKVLLVEDNPGDARLVTAMLAQMGTDSFSLDRVVRVGDAVKRLRGGNIDAVLLDLSLPDSQGLDTLTRIQTAEPTVPIVILSGDHDEHVAVQAVHSGAQNFLVKGQGDGNVLKRAIHYAVERKRAEQALYAAEKDADRANHFKSEFLAMMSHELRTPLTIIIGFSEMLTTGNLGKLTSKQKEYISDIHGAGNHLLDLISDILDLSKAEAGKMELDNEVLDAAQVIKACLRLMREHAANAGVRLNVKIIGELPFLHADRRKLKQILINLLSNAVKFTPRGGSVTVKAVNEPARTVAIAVTDTGIGMATEDIPRAMTAYVQANGMSRRKDEGTGLGLPLTKALVELHGGSLDLRSELGVGTTAIVRIPAERIVASPDDTQSLNEANRKAS